MSAGIKTAYEKRLLIRALPRLIHGRWGRKATVSNAGDLEMRRYNSMNAVTSVLTEGSTPAQQEAPTITTISFDPAYYGAYLITTDRLELEQFDPIISEISAILGEQCGYPLKKAAL